MCFKKYFVLNLIFFLCLQKGEIIIVIKMNFNGFWEGEVNGKKGMFLFIYVKFLEDNLEDGI